jgi:hypothetical protein
MLGAVPMCTRDDPSASLWAAGQMKAPAHAAAAQRGVDHTQRLGEFFSPVRERTARLDPGRVGRWSLRCRCERAQPAYVLRDVAVAFELAEQGASHPNLRVRV